MSKERLEFAHALRGIAAISVLVVYFFGVFWSSPSAVSSILGFPALSLEMPKYFATLHFSPHFNYGSFGVAVFFVIVVAWTIHDFIEVPTMTLGKKLARTAWAPTPKPKEA